ncbi:MAG: hypothetical protein IPK07_34190 [Deltaproteobacteria bacterium]|nr:hypothetical protein [Deltaproteobacteria bacterium]
MSAVGPFESFYGSAAQQPASLWVAALVGWAGVLVLEDRPRSVRRFASACAALAILDAWLTANHVLGIGALPGVLATAAPLCFVLAGDLRVFLFLDVVNVSEPRTLELRRARWGRVLALTVLVPVIAFGVVKPLADSLAAPDAAGRILFLGYELLFLALILVLRQRVLPRQLADRGAVRGWARSVASFVAVYYGLWALADLWILLAPPPARDLGFGLRVLPNLLYYGGLGPWIAWRSAIRKARVDDPGIGVAHPDPQLQRP